MILLHIITNDRDQATEISNYLYKEKLILKPYVIKETELLDGGEQNNYILMCKTKGLLFNDIDGILRKKYPDNLPVIFSVPIVNMDWDQSKELIKSLKEA